MAGRQPGSSHSLQQHCPEEQMYYWPPWTSSTMDWVTDKHPTLGARFQHSFYYQSANSLKGWVVQHWMWSTHTNKCSYSQLRQRQQSLTGAHALSLAQDLVSFCHSFTSTLAAQNATHSGTQFGNVFGWSTPRTENNFCSSPFTPTLPYCACRTQQPQDHSHAGGYSMTQLDIQPQTGLQHLFGHFFQSIWSWQSQ